MKACTYVYFDAAGHGQDMYDSSETRLASSMKVSRNYFVRGTELSAGKASVNRYEALSFGKLACIS